MWERRAEGGAGLYVSDPGGLSVPDTDQSAPTKLNVTPCPIPSLLSTSLTSFNRSLLLIQRTTLLATELFSFK